MLITCLQFQELAYPNKMVSIIAKIWVLYRGEPQWTLFTFQSQTTLLSPKPTLFFTPNQRREKREEKGRLFYKWNWILHQIHSPICHALLISLIHSTSPFPLLHLPSKAPLACLSAEPWSVELSAVLAQKESWLARKGSSGLGSEAATVSCPNWYPLSCSGWHKAACTTKILEKNSIRQAQDDLLWKLFSKHSKRHDVVPLRASDFKGGDSLTCTTKPPLSQPWLGWSQGGTRFGNHSCSIPRPSPPEARLCEASPPYIWPSQDDLRCGWDTTEKDACLFEWQHLLWLTSFPA